MEKKELHISEKKYFTFYKYYLHLKALCDYHDGETKAARQTMRQLVNLGPKLGYWITTHHKQYYLTEAARMEYEMQNYDEAEKFLSESLAYSPDYPYALFYKGKVLIAQGKTSEGKESGERIVLKTSAWTRRRTWSSGAASRAIRSRRDAAR